MYVNYATYNSITILYITCHVIMIKKIEIHIYLVHFSNRYILQHQYSISKPKIKLTS